MVNKIGYKELPNKDEFLSLYEKHSQRELAKIYGCNELRIRNWIKHFGLTPRSPGGGNNRKYKYDDDLLRDLVAKGLTNKQISEQLNIPKRNIKGRLFKLKIKRSYNYRISDFNRYARKARLLTETTYTKYKEVLNPNNLPRTLCGVENGYQLDHIISIRECFDSGKSVEECSDLNNLQFIPWEDNLKKRKFSRGCNND